MKLLTFEAKGGAQHVGAKIDEGIVDLTAALASTHPDERHAGSLLEIIRSGIDIDTLGGQSIERLRRDGKLKDFLVANPVFLPPIMRPSKILALALNFREHIDETNLKFYEEPIVFTKYTSNLLAHDGEIELPPYPQKVDEEHELAVRTSAATAATSARPRRPTIFSATPSATTSRRATASASAAR